MSTAILLLFLALALLTVAFIAFWFSDLKRRGIWPKPGGYRLLVGFVTDFLDTLGVGSFATTTSFYRLRRTVEDENIPGTLNVGHCLPTIAQAFIYTTIIEVEAWTLVSMIAASSVGAWLGAGVVSRWPRWRIQVGMGLALLAAAGLMLARQLGLLASGGDALGLSGGWLIIGLGGNLLFGALMTIGIGAYAPIMILVSLLGMNQKTAFPIMMGSCAFLMPVAAVRFIRSGRYDPQAALGLTLAGVPGVLLAAYLVKELPLDVIRWLVVAIVIYTAATLLRAARAESTTSRWTKIESPLPR